MATRSSTLADARHDLAFSCSRCTRRLFITADLLLRQGSTVKYPMSHQRQFLPGHLCTWAYNSRAENLFLIPYLWPTVYKRTALNSMSTQAGPSSARSSLRGSRRDAARQQQANGGVSERTPLVAGTAPGSGSNRLYNSTTLDPERSPSQVRSKMNVTIASPTPSIRSVSDVYADEYDDEEGEDDGREVEVYVPGKSTSLQTVSRRRQGVVAVNMGLSCTGCVQD